MNNPPFFIIGVPRSGTTLLRDLLARHSQVALPPEETQFLPDLIGIAEQGATGSQFNAAARSVIGKSNYAFLMARRHGMDTEMLAGGLSATEPMSALREVVLASSGKPNAKHWGDKTPNYAWMVDRILQKQPGARFVYIARDPRDVALSMAHAWGKSAMRAAMDWNKTEGLVSGWKSSGVLHTNLLEVSYEDLLTMPKRTIAKVCGFLGLAYEDGMLDLNSSSERWGDGAEHVGIKSNNTGKYLKSKNKRLVEVVERYCSRAMLDRGYQPMMARVRASEKAPSVMTMRAISAMDSFRAMRCYIRDFGVISGVRYKLRQRGVRRLRGGIR